LSSTAKKEKSAVPKRKRVKVKEAAKPARPVVQKPVGRVPTAMVVARRGTETVEREGRGFSKGELSGAELPPLLAARWKVPVDLRRRSVLRANVSALKKWFVRPKKPRPAEGRKPVQAEKRTRKAAPRKKKEE
jgi:ribosomal protein L13E